MGGDLVWSHSQWEAGSRVQEGGSHFQPQWGVGGGGGLPPCPQGGVTVFVKRFMSLSSLRSSSGDRGRSKKWKELLKLPAVAQCLCLRDEIGECTPRAWPRPLPVQPEFTCGCVVQCL